MSIRRALREFAWTVVMPSWRTFSENERLATDKARKEMQRAQANEAKLAISVATLLAEKEILQKQVHALSFECDAIFDHIDYWKQQAFWQGVCSALAQRSVITGYSEMLRRWMQGKEHGK